MGDSTQPHPAPDPSPSPAAPAASPADALSPGQRNGGTTPSSAQAWYADEDDERLVASEAAAAPSDVRGGRAASGSPGAPAVHDPADAGQAGGSSRAGNHRDRCAVLHACAAFDVEIWALHASLACDHAPCPVAETVHSLMHDAAKTPCQACTP